MIYPARDESVAAYFTRANDDDKIPLVQAIHDLEIHFYSFFICLFSSLASKVQEFNRTSHHTLAEKWWDWLAEKRNNRTGFYSEVVSKARKFPVDRISFYGSSLSFIADFSLFC